MSAIAGFFLRGGAPAEPGHLEPMLAAMRHRAPHGARRWCGGSVGLGHGALNTTPESLHEKLPLFDGADGLAITGDLRIDNRRELIRTLDTGPRAGRDIGDGELVLQAYRRWGREVPEHLVGAFAFVVWDGRRQEIFCARDQLGAKPFVYHLTDRAFVFASEVEGVLAFADVPRRMNEIAIADFLAVELEGIDHTSTIYLDVVRLPPAATLIVGRDGHIQRRYWQPDISAELRLRRDEDYVEAFRFGFSDTVGACLRSAAPAAVMLSGGIDSGAIAATAANELKRSGGPILRTHSVARDDAEPDFESMCLRAMVAHLGCVSTVATLSQVAALDTETRRAGLHSFDFFDSNMTVQDLVYRSQAKEGARVVLDGVDGDVVMSLGRAHIVQLIRRGERFRAFREAWAFSRRRASASVPWRGLLGAARTALVPEGAQRFVHRCRRSVGGAARPYHTSIINPDFAKRVDLESRVEYLDTLHWFESSGNARQDQADSLTHPFIAAAMERYDRVAARHGVEARHPLLGLGFVELCLSLPWHLKMRDGWTKYILRRSTAGMVPEMVRWRSDKRDVFWAYTSAIVAEERAFLGWVVEHHRDALDSYVDLTRLRGIVRRLEDGISPIEEESLWCAASLALWLDRERVYY